MTFEQEVEAALFAATDPLTDHHPFDISLARHIRKLAPRVAAAIEAGAHEAMAYTGLSAGERAPAVTWMHEHALDVLRGVDAETQPKETRND